MTVLDCFKQASRRLLAQDQNSLFTGSDPFQIKMQTIITEAALDLAQHHDWMALTKQCTLTTDGSTADFDLPADYGRMLVKADVHSSIWSVNYQAVRDLDEWTQLQRFMPSTIPGYWVIYGGQMHLMPVPRVDENPCFWYVSNNLVKGADGTQKPLFTTDADTFLLDEQLLTLAMIWRWKQAEGLDYQEDMQNYEIRLSQVATKDHGSLPIRSNRRGINRLGIWAIAR
ncbi:phage adaptor protein [Acetobacter cerevisiae]|uniref:Uncharacterized protein n=1 Tax=Acetobacter cerevisiae TaxID=178900 RepID=A0A149VF00_9PROT|nr:hypothetical protein [Acetobacter cerevisiae]KXV78779.1 hypothetical protein AD954_01290 [Acetobacter cerevisiae]